MRPRGVVVRRGDARRANVIAQLNQLQHVLHRLDAPLAEADNLHLTPGVLQHAQLLLVVQQVKDLARVDLKEAGRHVQVLAPHLRNVQLRKDVPRGQRVDALRGVLRLPVKVAAHRMGLAAARLPVGEAGGHAALKDGLHQRLRRVLVHQLIVRRLVKGVVKSKALILQVLRQVDLLLRFMHHHQVLRGNGYHIDVLPRGLPLVQRPLPHGDADLVVVDDVIHGDGVELHPTAKLLDHAEKLPLLVRGGALQLHLLRLLLRLAGATLVALLLNLLHLLDGVRAAPVGRRISAVDNTAVVVVVVVVVITVEVVAVGVAVAIANRVDGG